MSDNSLCRTCKKPINSARRTVYCSDVCSGAVKVLRCVTCSRPFLSRNRRSFCERPECRQTRAPAVYRYVCPDGRSYVGAVADVRRREKEGVGRRNPRLVAAFEKYPPPTWTYEVLESLTPGCSKEELREAEQRHMERLRSLEPEHGFNINPAVWQGDRLDNASLERGTEI
jgi:hypothetical protein